MKLKQILFLAKKNFSFRTNSDKKKGKNSKSRGSRPLPGAIFGIALSLVPLTVVIHISDAMIRGITDRTIETSLYHFQAYTYNDERIENIAQTAQMIKDGSDQIIQTHTECEGFGLIYNSEGRIGTTIRCLPENIYKSDKGFARFLELTEGEFDLSGKRSILLGAAVAEELNTGVGEKVNLMSARVLPDGTVLPKILQFTVKGIFSTGYRELDKLWTFIPYETGRILFTPENSKTMIGIKVKDPYRDTTEMKEILYDLTDGKWEISDWRDSSYFQQNLLRTTKAILILIMVLLVFIATLNVSSSLTMVVLEQQQAIGILKCTGTSPEIITGLYLILGTVVGVAGAALGLTAGTLFSVFINQIISGTDFLINHIYSLISFILSGWVTLPEENFQLVNTAYYLDTLAVETEWAAIFITAVGTVILSVLFSLFPARRAVKIRPLEVIRKV